MRAGRLRYPVTILQPSVASGIQTWTTFASVWAGIEPASGSETAHGDLEPMNVTVINVTIRFIPGVRPRMRITWNDGYGSRTVEIDDVIDPGENQRMLNLTCREVAS